MCTLSHEAELSEV